MNQSGVVARRRFLQMAAALPLAGCSMRPLYGNQNGTIDVAGDLAAVQVPEQQTRAGQLVRNQLLTIMRTDAAGARYTLGLTFREGTAPVSTLPDEVTGRNQYNLTATYKLSRLSDGKQVLTGSLNSFVQYDTLRQPVADLQAKRDAMERATGEIAQDLRLRIAAWFADNKT